MIGAGSAGEKDLERARLLGAGLAEAGAVVVCGGLGGVMEAAARGCTEAGGMAVGILPGPDDSAANRWIALPLATGMGEARNVLVVRAAEAVVAVGGSWGTLSEIALARKIGVAVAVLGAPPADGLSLDRLADPREAVAWALARVRERRRLTSVRVPSPQPPAGMAGGPDAAGRKRVLPSADARRLRDR